MKRIQLISRRAFLNRSLRVGVGAALASLANIPGLMKHALASGPIGLNGKKLLFIFLRGANDGLNSLIPVGDPAYGPGIRPTLAVPLDSEPGFYTRRGACFDPTQFADASGASRTPNAPTFSYTRAIPVGNGFAALHPSLKFLAPVYNAGDLLLIHRVGYPNQSRSHFDSQAYWETAAPNDSQVRDGVFYRALLESGLAQSQPLTGVSIQSSLPLILRGSQAAMTNIPDLRRYALLGVPGGEGLDKAEQALREANGYPFVDKRNRELLKLHYQNLLSTLPLFEEIAAQLETDFVDNEPTDGDYPYALFPVSNETNGGYVRSNGTRDPSKYVVDTDAYDPDGTGFFNHLKAAALVLNKTDAIIAGTELGGFDTHNNQGLFTGRQPDLLRRVGWAIYALRKYFLQHADRVSWENLIVVTLSEFGRTTVENSNQGTDHAEANLMLVAGGSVRGFQEQGRSGVVACHPADPVPWIVGPADQGDGISGSMFGVRGRYLKRAVDYRSVLGEIIREHLGATASQLQRIIPAYAVAAERLEEGGISGVDGTPIMGEVGLLGA